MLNGSNATLNGMLMGAIVTAPPPGRPDVNITPYDVHGAMYVDVIKNDVLPVGNPSPEADSWLPMAMPPPYDEVVDAWQSPSKIKTQSIVDSLASAFKWTEKLIGDAPPLLLDNIRKVYLNGPSLTVA